MKRLVLAGLLLAGGALGGGCRERQEAERSPPSSERDLERKDVGPVRGAEERACEMEQDFEKGTQGFDEGFDLGHEAERR